MSKSDQIGKLYKVCNEKSVWQNRAEKAESELAAKDAAADAKNAADKAAADAKAAVHDATAPSK